MIECLRWRRSSHSASGSDCVELAHTLDAIRDSKNPGTALTVSARALLDAAKFGRVEVP